MNTVKEIVISLIFCALAVGLCEMLVPKHSYKNQMRLITGTVLLVSMLSPFITDYNFESISIPSFNDSVEVSDSASRTVAYALKNEIQEIIYDYNIKQAKIIIKTGEDENKSIIIDSVIILFDKKDKGMTQKVVKQIENKINVKIQVGEL